MPPTMEPIEFKAIVNFERLFTKPEEVKKIIFNDPATVILWSDGSKTVVKRAVGDVYDPYAGFCAAVTKKVIGNNSRIKRLLKQRSNYDEVKHEQDEV